VSKELYFISVFPTTTHKHFHNADASDGKRRRPNTTEGRQGCRNAKDQARTPEPKYQLPPRFGMCTLFDINIYCYHYYHNSINSKSVKQLAHLCYLDKRSKNSKICCSDLKNSLNICCDIFILLSITPFAKYLSKLDS
jgi:hypothetical protein